MLFLVSGVFVLGSLVTLGLLIAKAPEAYETEEGLRIVRPPSKTRQRRGAHLPATPALP